METTAGEPTDDNRVGTFALESPWKVLHHCNCHGTLNAVCFSLSQDKFIGYLLKGTKKLTSAFALQNNHTISHIINCSTGILLLSMKKCDIQDNPNPTVSSKECVTVTTLSNHTHFVIIMAATVRWCWIFFILSSLCLRMSLRSFGQSLCWWVWEPQREWSSGTQQAPSIRASWYFLSPHLCNIHF